MELRRFGLFLTFLGLHLLHLRGLCLSLRGFWLRLRLSLCLSFSLSFWLRLLLLLTSGAAGLLFFVSLSALSLELEPSVVRSTAPRLDHSLPYGRI